jgi:hypothetical protein
VKFQKYVVHIVLTYLAKYYDAGGEDHEHTIISGAVLAIALLDASLGMEARELLTKLLATSKQVAGHE